MPINPIENFYIEKSDFRFIGHDLNKPTSIIATQDNHLWVSDSRGGVTQISLETQAQTFIGEPLHSNDQISNMIFIDQQTMMITNIGRNCIETLNLPTGKRVLMFDSIDGVPIGKVNFLLTDSKKRIWLSVSTRKNNIIDAFNPDINDGYIALIENNKIRIIAEGFAFANEIRMDVTQRYLYVSETGKCRILRMPVHANGTLGEPEVYGPTHLGPANFPDGITFDSYGNLWGTIIGGDKIFVLTPEGDLKIIFDGGDPELIKIIDHAYQQRTLTLEMFTVGPNKIVPAMTSITFAGNDLKTAYIGCYGTSLPYFQAPVSGLKSV